MPAWLLCVSQYVACMFCITVRLSACAVINTAYLPTYLSTHLSERIPVPQPGMDVCTTMPSARISWTPCCCWGQLQWQLECNLLHVAQPPAAAAAALGVAPAPAAAAEAEAAAAAAGMVVVVVMVAAPSMSAAVHTTVARWWQLRWQL